MTTEELRRLVDRTVHLAEGGEAPRLPGKRVMLAFYEPSTRTQTSFAVAATRLGAEVYVLPVDRSSVVKGESLTDTVRTLASVGADAVVLRHPAAGAPARAAQACDVAVINAGDGSHEHPTQALLDVCTVLRRRGRVEGLVVTILGDVRHSRVARSDILAFSRLGARVRVSGPPPLVPPSLAALGAEVVADPDEAVRGADVIQVLRIQRERLAGEPLPPPREYLVRYGLTARRLALARPEVLVLHPGPMNRGVEIEDEVADGPSSAVRDQVACGVPVRMAVLAEVLGGREAEGA